MLGSIFFAILSPCSQAPPWSWGTQGRDREASGSSRSGLPWPQPEVIELVQIICNLNILPSISPDCRACLAESGGRDWLGVGLFLQVRKQLGVCRYESSSAHPTGAQGSALCLWTRPSICTIALLYLVLCCCNKKQPLLSCTVLYCRVNTLGYELPGH